jgi:tetratricopeptide (TPR) repeat protein
MEKTCPNCQRPLRADARFCSSCGFAMAQADSPLTSAELLNSIGSSGADGEANLLAGRETIPMLPPDPSSSSIDGHSASADGATMATAPDQAGRAPAEQSPAAQPMTALPRLPDAGRKVCFVISPIGEPGSPERIAADNAFELLIQPALELFRFDEIVRADQIPRPSMITTDIIGLIQESALCIIDLTGKPDPTEKGKFIYNANVFYECGRRHETSKPAIQIIEKGQQLPFDLSGIRTVVYDLASAKSTRDSVKQLQRFVEEFEKQGYGTGASGASLSTIAGALDRIERKLATISASGGGAAPVGVPSGGVSLEDLQNPRRAFVEAMRANDFDKAVRLLPTMQTLYGPTDELVYAAAMVMVTGHPTAVGIAQRLIIDPALRSKLSEDGIHAGVGALVSYYGKVDKEEEAIPLLQPILLEEGSRPDRTAEQQAWYLNQLQKLYYGNRDYRSALGLGERVIQLAPDDPFYNYNLSLIYEKLDRLADAKKRVDRYLALGSQEEAHLSHAVQILVKVGDVGRASMVFEALQTVDRRSAQELLDDDELVRKALGSS